MKIRAQHSGSYGGDGLADDGAGPSVHGGGPTFNVSDGPSIASGRFGFESGRGVRLHAAVVSSPAISAAHTSRCTSQGSVSRDFLISRNLWDWIKDKLGYPQFVRLEWALSADVSLSDGLGSVEVDVTFDGPDGAKIQTHHLWEFSQNVQNPTQVIDLVLDHSPWGPTSNPGGFQDSEGDEIEAHTGSYKVTIRLSVVGSSSRLALVGASLDGSLAIKD